MLLLLALSLVPVSAFADGVEVTIPEERWSILFDSPPLSQEDDARTGANYAFRANSGVFNITIYVETPQGGGTSRGKWVDVHISILQPTRADEATSRAFDRSLR